jgi:hypothetical protein
MLRALFRFVQVDNPLKPRHLFLSITFLLEHVTHFGSSTTSLALSFAHFDCHVSSSIYPTALNNQWHADQRTLFTSWASTAEKPYQPWAPRLQLSFSKQFTWPTYSYTATRSIRWRPWLVSKWVIAQRSWGVRGGGVVTRSLQSHAYPFTLRNEPPRHKEKYYTSKYALLKQMTASIFIWFGYQTVHKHFHFVITCLNFPYRMRALYKLCSTWKQILLGDSKLAIPRAVILAYLTFISRARRYFYQWRAFWYLHHHLKMSSMVVNPLWMLTAREGHASC